MHTVWNLTNTVPTFCSHMALLSSYFKVSIVIPNYTCTNVLEIMDILLGSHPQPLPPLLFSNKTSKNKLP